MMARDVTHLLEGQWFGRYGTAPCPVCQPDRQRDQNALTLNDGNNGRLLAHCKKSACAFSDILAATGLRSGDYTAPDAATLAQRASERRAEAQRQALRASYLWKEAQPVTGTLAETYLRWRGITCTLPVTLRFHPECWHGPTAKRYPALVALVEGSEGFAVHRTYLSVDGTRKAALDPARMMLGTVAGGAVRLVDGLGPLVLAEGIETALSLASGLLRAPASIWAALSTSGMRGLRLPSTPGRLTITPDGDSAGREAAHALAERATALGWAVSLLPAPEGRDWNDILQMKGVAT